jgi:hypothetical protein
MNYKKTNFLVWLVVIGINDDGKCSACKNENWIRKEILLLLFQIKSVCMIVINVYTVYFEFID